jgi:hypothetical protein
MASVGDRRSSPLSKTEIATVRGWNSNSGKQLAILRMPLRPRAGFNSRRPVWELGLHSFMSWLLASVCPLQRPQGGMMARTPSSTVISSRNQGTKIRKIKRPQCHLAET